ncbi:hypothetical protein DYB32_003846 [Aphanomyces invadans]|uniref:Uncharacterized protein n=1 Tax=Aphanomyces invadans TaxID=157072 RepID=A0A418AZA3_9STRA|nr:hypothetical protein DYB32_003846 [Aphanomyces invadans]
MQNRIEPHQMQGLPTYASRREVVVAPLHHPLAPNAPQDDANDNQLSQNDEDECDDDDDVETAVSAQDIVEELSVAMYTLRHRLNLDAREKHEKDAMDAAQKSAKAKAAADAELAKQRAEQAQRDEANARVRVKHGR